MSTGTLKKKLAMAKKQFKKAKERASEMQDYGEIEDGRYKCKLVDASGPDESQSSGRLQFCLVFEIQEGEYEGQRLYRYSGLENEDQLMYAVRDLARFGVEIDDLDELEDLLQELAKQEPEVLITAKTKGDFQNYHIGKVSGVEMEEEEEEDPEEEEEESEEEESEEEESEEEEEEEPEDPEEEPEEEEEEPEEEEEEAEEEEEEEGIELEEGSPVDFTFKGKKLSGKIVDIIDENTARVESSAGKKYKVSVDNLEPAKSKPAKKPTKKPIKKKAPAKKKTTKKVKKVKRKR